MGISRCFCGVCHGPVPVLLQHGINVRGGESLLGGEEGHGQTPGVQDARCGYLFCRCT